MKAKDIIKQEYTEKMTAIQDMMDTAPDLSCCIITLMVAENEIQRILKDIAGAIDYAKKGGENA